MPIVHTIDHDARLVIALLYGVLTDADVFGYQRNVWSQDEVAGYDELIDVTHVTQIALPSSERVRDLAALSAEMDQKVFKSRSAIVAPDDYAFGLGRMYQTYRELNRESTKEVGVFRTMEEALAYLQIDRAVVLPEPV